MVDAMSSTPAAVPNTRNLELTRSETALTASTSVLAAATWGVQATIYDYGRDLPAVLETVANSGGHPILGVAGAIAGRLAERGNAWKAAGYGLAATVMIDLFTEQTQDLLFYQHKPPFYAPSRIGENLTDLKFALGGFAAVLVTRHGKTLWSRSNSNEE